MIDIDILSQLIPNPITMVVQLCSTLVLFLLMKKFLWTSVQNFLGKRADKMQSDLEESEALKKAASVDREKASQELGEASNKSQQIVDAAIKEAKAQKDVILQEAQKEAQNTMQKAEDRINKQKIEMVASMQKEMVDIAMAATEKLIGSKSDAQMDKEAVDSFVRKRQAMINEVADRYSEGLFLLAKESNDISNKKKQALGLLKVFEETPDLALFFKAVKVSAEEKKALICKVFGNEIDKDLLHFLELLVDKDRMGYVQEILREYVRKINDDLGIKKAIVYSVRPLEESDLTKIKEALNKKHNCIVELENKLDPGLIAGIKVVMENQVTDISMKNKIDSLKESLLKGGLA